MSICIAIAVPDGIALAADSQTTWTETITKAKNKATNEEFELLEPIKRPIGWSRMTKKLFDIEISNKRYAILWAGTASINKKSNYSIFKSLEKRCNLENPTKAELVNYLVNGIKAEFIAEFGNENLAECATRRLDFIICGFNDDDVSKPFIQKHHVFSGVIKNNGVDDNTGHIIAWDQNETHGGCWIGRTEFITHIVNHKNKSLPAISGQYSLMSLSDAIDYTKFMVEYTCDFQRFAITVPDCARPIISASLTPEQYFEEII